MMSETPFHIFIGHYLEALSVFHQELGVSLVLVEDKPSNQEILEYCKSHQIRFQLYSKATLEKIARFDFCLVASFGRILPTSFIRKGAKVVNLHPGDITRVRGRHPLPQAILNGDHLMGVTAHLIIDHKIDDGPLIQIHLTPIDYSASYESNDSRLRSLVPGITREVLNQLRNEELDSAVSIAFPETTYYSPLNPATLGRIISAKSLLSFLQE